MKEIEIYENVNKTVKEITDNDFDLAGEWAETLKHCGMTQEEFLRFCGMKITSKLTNAIEYLYKILIDKNIQIKLLSQENETLNEENIRLNKINIEMESIINYNHINNNNIKYMNSNIKNENKKIYKKEKNKNHKITRNNSFFDDYKNKFLNESKNKHNNSSSKNELQSTFVNVDNNITHTNININMMMDYDHINEINKNSVTSSEFRDGLLLNDLDNINNQPKMSKSINKTQNINNYNLIEPKKYNKTRDKVLRYLKLNNRKINNNSYNKLIIEKKNDINEKTQTQNISTIKKSCKNFDKLNAYNRTIKNIFSNTEKIQIKKIKKNVNQNYKANENKGLNLNTDTIIKNIKMIKKSRLKRKNNNNNEYNIHCKSENKVSNQYKNK